MHRRAVIIAAAVIVLAAGIVAGVWAASSDTTGTVTAAIPDQVITIPGTTTVQTYTIPTVTETVTTSTEPPPPPPVPPPPGYIKVLDSSNGEPVGKSTDSNNCTLNHADDPNSDTFNLASNSTRCTWTNQHFSHMHRHEVFEVTMNFTSRVHGATDWENEINMRPYGSFGNSDCDDGGNHEVMLISVYVQRGTPDRWQLDIRGGTSLNLSDQIGPSREDPARPPIQLGPVVENQPLKLKFDLVADYQHGAATVWENDDPNPIYDNRDRPLGFHFDCNGTTDISNFDLRMQHGVYRGWTGFPLTFTSSGFGFLVSEPE